MSRGPALTSEAQEVALAEAQAVRALRVGRGVPRAARRADRRASTRARSRARTRRRSSELLELGLQSGRIRALYGPGGEQAALRCYRRLPRGAELDRERARGDRGAAGARGPASSARVELTAVGPGRVRAVARRRRGSRSPSGSTARARASRASAT